MCVCLMADIIHAFFCVCSAARYLNIATAIMGLYQKVSGTAPLLAALKGRFRLFIFFPFDENTTISRFHLFTFSRFRFLRKHHDFTFSPFRLFAFSPFHKFTNSQIHKFTNSRIHKFTNSHHQSPETMLSPFISPPMAITSRR